jgi:methionyl aminopeptidase
MIFYKTNQEVELLRKSNLLVGEVIAEIAKNIKPGVTPAFLDKLAYDFITAHNAVPAFLNYQVGNHAFPNSVCISVNSAVVHGIPNTTELKPGDIVSIDTGVLLNEFIGDSAYTFAIGEVVEPTLKLMRITKESLYKGIEQAIAGRRIGDIGYAVQNHTEYLNKYGVVRDLCGHGLGRSLHEEPEVPNYGRRGNGPKLQEGLVIAIEPMINIGTKDVHVGSDNWTIFTNDNSMSAHYEHTICVRKNKADILSSFDAIETAEKANGELNSTYY